MNLKRLQALIEIADRGSFSEAATALGLTQPAVSKQIKTLEAELSAVLFRRDQSHVELTDAGKIAYQAGRRLLLEWDELVMACAAHATQVTGMLRIGASTIAGTYLIPRVIERYRGQYPHVELSVDVGPSGEILERLVHGLLDVAVVGSAPSEDDLRAEILCQDSIVFIGPQNAPPVTDFPSALSELPIIVREHRSGTQRTVERHLQLTYGLRPHDLHTIAHVMDTSALVAMVESGVGYGFVSRLAVARAHVQVIYELKAARSFYTVTAATVRHDFPLRDTFCTALRESFHDVKGESST